MFVVMSAETVVTVAGYTVFSGSKFDQPFAQFVAGVPSVTGKAPCYVVGVQNASCADAVNNALTRAIDK